MQQYIDYEWIFIDESIGKVHQPATGANRQHQQAIDKSVVNNEGMDWRLYRYRHLVENIFTFLKQYRAIATR